MSLFLAVIVVLLAGGLLALAASSLPRVATLLGAGSAVLACGLGVVPAAQALLRHRPESLRLPWDVPFGSFAIRIDALSAFFLLPILVLCGLAAIYGAEYLLAYREHKNLGVPWFFYNVLIASMLLVVTAGNGVLFLVAWEVMSLASYFLVTFEHEKAEVRRAGWTYLVATHIGTTFLLMMFILLGNRAGSLDFDAFGTTGAPMSGIASVLFLCALIGFGTKAGLMPLHVWLPEAHPAAPSHVSAVMSGVMIKTGIYGLLRVLTFLGTPPPWWGWLLIGLGVFGGVMGILTALAQLDLKRMLAYSSVENIGIITLSLGLGMLGISYGWPLVAALGLCGGLLHVVNHAMFKGLLFLGAGTVLHGTGTLRMDVLGGLLKRMPITGLTFLVAAAAICGLPPLNGFVGEFLVYLGAYKATTTYAPATAIPGLAVIAGLALIGGLAAACFTKAFGIVFLGEPRSEQARHAHAPGIAMVLPMVLLMGACFLLGLFGPRVAQFVQPVIVDITHLPTETVQTDMAVATDSLSAIVIVALGFLLLVLLLAMARAGLLAGRSIGRTGTWDCGYAAPTARMQYTGSSFAQPLTRMFRTFLRASVRLEPPRGLFPGEANLATQVLDIFTENLYRPVFLATGWVVSKLRLFQHGRLQLYVLYIAATLLVLLVWKLG